MAQSPDDSAQAVAADQHVQTHAFEPVRIKKSVMPVYPYEARADYEEGWVQLDFMVSTEGKAYQAFVSHSVGSKAFERAALVAIKDFTFDPARENGRPVDSAVSLKMKFELNGGMVKGARDSYISAYHAFDKAISAGDRAAADLALSHLHVTNLYEDAYFGLAQYRYAIKWGNEADQLSGLRRAVAYETTAHYLPKPLFASALQDLFRLEVKAQDFAAALSTWEAVQKSGLDPAATLPAAAHGGSDQCASNRRSSLFSGRPH